MREGAASRQWVTPPKENNTCFLQIGQLRVEDSAQRDGESTRKKSIEMSRDSVDSKARDAEAPDERIVERKVRCESREKLQPI